MSMPLRKPVMFCMMMRGVEKQNARTTTAEYLGEHRRAGVATGGVPAVGRGHGRRALEEVSRIGIAFAEL